jgi:7-keto-8-aminopelargonate synthetase-like enzyme
VREYRLVAPFKAGKFTHEEPEIITAIFGSRKEAQDYAEKLKKEGKIDKYAIEEADVEEK